MLRAILFDLDGVLTCDKTGSLSTLRSLSKHTGIPFEPLRAAYFRHNREMLLGQLTHADIWPEMCAEVGRNVDPALLHTAFIETPMNREMLHFVRELREEGYLIALVTDNKADRVHAILEHHALYGLFDLIAISSEVGISKWEAGIFRHVLGQLGLNAPECLFVDNTPRNLIAPEALGMHTLLFDDERQEAAQVRAAIREIGRRDLHES